MLSPAPEEPARRHHGEGRGQAVAGLAQRPVQTRASHTEARPRAQEPRQSPAIGEREETTKLELCSLVHPGPEALLPAPHLTSPKLQNPNTVGPPLCGSGTEVGGSGSLTVPLLPPGTPRAKTASGGSGLWTRRPSRLVSSGFQPRPRRAVGSRETDPVPPPWDVHSGIPRQPSLARCCL